MSRPGTAPPSGAEQARSPARIALAVGLLALGIGDLAVINFVLVPLRNAEGNYRLHAVARYRVPGVNASGTALVRTPTGVRDALAAEATNVDSGRAPAAPVPAAPVAATPPAPAVVAGTAEAVPPEDFPDLLFAINTTWLSRPSREILDRVAEALARNPDRRVVLSGHTDGAGDPELNRALSRERAARASRYLRARGVEPGRIEMRAFGAKQPVETAGPSEFRPRNRRVEITVE
jgi:outer membrane protein OmpA-like peptidoglycan-associated protein